MFEKTQPMVMRGLINKCNISIANVPDALSIFVSPAIVVCFY